MASQEEVKVSLRRKRTDAVLEQQTPKKLRQTRPALSAHKPALSDLHRAVVDAFFDNGCVSRRRAMEAAGYSPASARNNTTGVFGREDVVKEIQRRRNMAQGRRGVTEDWIIEQFRKLASASMGDLLDVNEDGSAYLDLNAMTDDHRAALMEFTSEEAIEKGTTEGEDGPELSLTRVRKSRAKFASKQAALDSLARILGMFKDKLEVGGVVSIADKFAAARKRIVSDADAERKNFIEPAPE